jgi:anti-sigma B factor antagonist
MDRNDRVASPMSVGIATRLHEDVAELILAGELEMASVDRVDAELRRLESEDVSTILVDLRRLDFMDSAGVRMIVQADRRARDAGRRLAVMAGFGIPLLLFRTLGLEERLDIVDAGFVPWRGGQAR